MKPEQARLAEALARRAHEGQTDRTGRPYWRHLAAVAEALTTAEGRATAWLHDVVEDTGETPATLSGAGVDAAVIDNVETLTRRGGETYAAYIERIAASGNETAIAVKLADLDEHLGHRASELPASLTRRYETARARLEAAAAKATRRLS